MDPDFVRLFPVWPASCRADLPVFTPATASPPKPEGRRRPAIIISSGTLPLDAASLSSVSAPGVFRGPRVNPIPIHARNPGPITGDGNWTWLLPGRTPTLIDAGTGEPGCIEDVRRALGGSVLAQVLVTHGHGDHASGAPALARAFGGPRFLKWPWPGRDGKWSVDWQPIADGDRIPAGDTTLVVVHTPGHSPDHVCFWHPESRSLFGGDLAIRGTTVWIPTNLQGDLVAYLASLERVLELDPVRIFPAHGPVIDRPADLLRGYLAHRRAREEQIVSALRAGCATPEAIVRRVYGGLKDSLAPLAQESVMAHLLKLEGEGRARRDGDRWTATDRLRAAPTRE